MLHTIGITFPPNSQWYQSVQNVIKSLQRQISNKFPNDKNLLVTMTWFGPQFDNNEYNKFIDYVDNNTVDNIFLLATEDPCFLNKDETRDLILKSKAKNSFLIGNFDTKYNFNFISTMAKQFFPTYKENNILMKTPKFLFLNYNRKPREHRCKFIKQLDNKKLTQYGLVTLGNDRNLGETIEDIGKDNQWWPDDYGIPHDIHSLGRLGIWQNHFLNIVSETDFEDFLWTFITEKTWKPIIGLRPFVLNGQQIIYKYLRKNGFKTFNHYWNHIDLEECGIDDIHHNICKVVKFLSTQDVKEMYVDMLSDLRYNRDRFYEFADEQKLKMETLFV